MSRKHISHPKGIAIFLVLLVILTVVVIANIVIILISSQQRFIHHEVSRIRAYYAAQAGINYAIEQLRRGQWSTGTYSLCSSGCTINDIDLPPSYRVSIIIGAVGSGIDNTREIRAIANYTYSP